MNRVAERMTWTETLIRRAAIASAIIAMGNSMKLRVIAEGVETEGQYTFLQEAMCDEIQGYLISRPIRPEKVGAFIRSRGWLERMSENE